MVFRPLALALAAGLSSALAFAQVAAEAPKTPLSLETRGDIFMARKMYREAIDVFREDKSKNPVIANKIGIAYHQMQQLDNARKSYELAIRLKPDYPEAINNLGTVYYARKSFSRAIRYYQRALKYAPNSASIYSNLGTAYFARKKYKEAMETYQTALKLDPNVFENHGSYGVLLEERNVEERAKFHFHMAKLYAQASRNELALQYLRKALEEGFKDKKKIEEDPDFAAMRDLPEFKELLALEPRVL
ncbi:MAG TPA: tetratricopeptide repeat protein [Bryobacteraceae bacterium]|nr:tetratricopeptide repeat protein [Bryobacteraceae bacterium]